MCRFREITRRLFVTHETGAFGVRRDVSKALYHTCHNMFSQRRTVIWLETYVPSNGSSFERTHLVLLGVYL